MMIEKFIYIFIGLLCMSCVFCLYRLIKGPSLADRVMALNTMTLVGVGLAVLLGSYVHELFIDVAIPLALIAFISTLVITKYLEGEIRI